MQNPSSRRVWLAAALATACWPALSQETFPAKPITLVVPFSAGSGTDQITRLLAKGLTGNLGVPVIVENKPGASGAIAASAAAKAKPDGYTLLIGSATTNAVNFSLFSGKLGYTPDSFEIISTLSSSPISLYVPYASPWKSVADLKAASAQARPVLTCGSGNAVNQVACEIFRQQARVPLINVPYKSNPNSLSDLAGGQIAFAFSDATAALALVESKRVRTLAVATTKRYPSYADTPTFEEAGVAKFEFTGWTAVFAPAGVPRPVIETLHQALVKVMALPEVAQYTQRTGSVVKSASLAESREFATQELARWSRYIKESNVKFDQ